MLFVSLRSRFPHLLFVEDLHGKVLSRFFVLDQHDSPEGARAQRLQPLELVQRRSVLGHDNTETEQPAHSEETSSHTN